MEVVTAVAVNPVSTLSVTVAVPRLTGVNATVASMVISAGAVKVGAVVSVTVTVWIAVLGLPAVSVTL